MDTLTPKQRSERMSRVRGKDTKAEMQVRRIVHGLGFRYRLHRKDLPGCPDLVFPARRKAIFVHGCFWHRHQGCRLARLPKSRLEFWQTKLESNRQRDVKTLRSLANLGWKVLVIWECQLNKRERLEGEILDFLDRGRTDAST